MEARSREGKNKKVAVGAAVGVRIPMLSMYRNLIKIRSVRALEGVREPVKRGYVLIEPR